jgi:hypothetical protein
MLKRKKAEDAAALHKAMEIAKDIEVPASSLFRADAVTDAQEVVKATEAVQELATSEAGNMLVRVNVGEGVQEDNTAGTDAAASEADTGIPESPHNSDIIVVESDSTQSTSSQSTSSSSSTDVDDLPIGLVYPTIRKGLSTSTETCKTSSQNIPFELMIPSVNERKGNMSEMRNKVCEKLPLNHPLQLKIIHPLNIVPPDENVESSSSHPSDLS